MSNRTINLKMGFGQTAAQKEAGSSMIPRSTNIMGKMSASNGNQHARSKKKKMQNKSRKANRG